MNNRLRNALRAVTGGNGKEPTPERRRVAITKTQAATIVQLQQTIAETHRQQQAVVVGILGGHNVEASQDVRLVGLEDGRPALEFIDLTTMNRWRAAHPPTPAAATADGQ